MNTKIQTMNFKILEKQGDRFEVIGCGEMPTEPIQVGEWWVTPAEQYKGKIPQEVQQKLFSFLNQGVKVKGFLIAEDMREIEEKQELEKKKKEAREKVLKVGAGVALATVALPVIGLGIGVLGLIAGLCAWDPMLLAVLDEENINGEGGRWVCLGTWYD